MGRDTCTMSVLLQRRSLVASPTQGHWKTLLCKQSVLAEKQQGCGECVDYCCG